MITKSEDVVQISIGQEELERALAEVFDLLDYMKDQEETKAKKALIKALSVASEAMQAFWLEHFGEGTDGDK